MDTAVVGVLALACLVLLATVQFAPQSAHADVAVIFPPWVTPAEAASRSAGAGASLVRVGAYPFIVIVRPLAADFARRARATGAVLLLDAHAIGGCFERRGVVA